MKAKKSPIQRTILKGTNITAVADGLNTSIISAGQFSEFGSVKSFFQAPQMAVVDFGKYSFFVQVDQRKALANDNSGDLTSNSPVRSMMKRFLQDSAGLRLSAVGFNFTFESILDVPLADFLRETYLQGESIGRFGKSFQSFGFKLTVVRTDCLLQISVDPIWQNPTTALVVLNFHHEPPGPDISSRLVEMYGTLVGEAPGIVDQIFSR